MPFYGSILKIYIYKNIWEEFPTYLVIPVKKNKYSGNFDTYMHILYDTKLHDQLFAPPVQATSLALDQRFFIKISA